MATRKKIPLIDASANLDVTGDVEIAGSGSAVVTFPSATSTLATTALTETFTNKTIDADLNTIQDLTVSNLKSGVLDTDLSSVSGSDDTIPSAKATKTALDAKMANPMTTQGDTIYGGASGAPTRLPKGTAGQVLTMNSGATAPEWAAAGGGSAPMLSTTSLSSTDITDGYTTPKELVPAPGAGKMILVHQVLYSYVHGGTTYTGGGSHQIRYAGDTVDLVNTGPSGNRFTAAASFKLTTVPISSGVGTGPVVTAGENAAVQWSNASGSYATGNGTAKIFVSYTIVTL